MGVARRLVCLVAILAAPAVRPLNSLRAALRRAPAWSGPGSSGRFDADAVAWRGVATTRLRVQPRETTPDAAVQPSWSLWGRITRFLALTRFKMAAWRFRRLDLPRAPAQSRGFFWGAKTRVQRVRTLARLLELRAAAPKGVLPTAEFEVLPGRVSVETLRQHPVTRLIKKRATEGYAPGTLADGCKLGLAVEGGGMRGAYAAGASTCLVSLGLTQSVDEVYGSSAGSVVGAYFVARQRDAWKVYTDAITHPSDRFVDLRRLPGALGILAFSKRSTWRRTVAPDGKPFEGHPDAKELLESVPSFSPVFNLNTLLDTMRPSGEHPLNWNVFRQRERSQRFFAIASASRRMESLALSSAQGDWGDDMDDFLAACRASTTVPAICGPALRLGVDRFGGSESELGGREPLSDALLLQPIPYRSAVENNCTHVLVLRSRPMGTSILGKAPSVYETRMSSRFYHMEGCPDAAAFISECQHQVVYAEDALLLSETSESGRPGRVPGHEEHGEAELLGIGPPESVKEIGQLDTKRENVLRAVVEGFIATYLVFGDTFTAERPRAQLEAEARAAATEIFNVDLYGHAAMTN